MNRSERRALLASIAGGCPPFERVNPGFEQVPGGLVVGRRLAADWFERAAPCPDRRTALVAAVGLSQEEIEGLFTPVRAQGEETPPLWATALQLLLGHLTADAISLDPDPTDAMAECLLPGAMALLNWSDLASGNAFLSSALLADLTVQLSTRVLLSSWSVLELESNFQKVERWDLGARAWLQRLSNFPGLAYVLGTAIRQWRQNALELLGRLNEEGGLLQREFFGGTAPGRLVSLRCDCGDRHDDGRSVAILGFESGSRVVYKPKNLRCADMALRTMDALNARAETCLPVRRILCRSHHTWEEFVEERQPTTVGEAARFFRNYGGVVRLLQFVEGRDFWMDNLRVDGDKPVFIDLECILHPRLKSPLNRAAGGMASSYYEESALPTAAITHNIILSDGSVVQFGGLSRPGARKLPLGKWTGSKDRASGSIWMKDGEIYWHPETAWPMVNGCLARPEDFIEELEAGYFEVNELLGDLGKKLVGEGGPLAQAGFVEVRVIMRSTWEYLYYLRTSLAATALLDGATREVVLAHVVGNAPDWGTRDDHLTRARIALAEVSALRKLDIPEFHNRPASSSIIAPDQVEIPDLFAGNGLDRLRQRAANPSSFDVDGHFAIIAGALREIAA